MAQRWTLRSLTAADREILRAATHMNMNWEGRERVPFRDIDHIREIRHYFALRPKRGDFGFVAEIDGLVVGVVWVMFFDAADPGYAFVGEGIPELSLSVWSGYRNQGLGGALLVRALQEARDRGIRHISVSVEEGNAALNLYRRVDFRHVDTGKKGTYVVTLGETVSSQGRR